MKRVFMIVLIAFIGLAFVTTGFAAAKDTSMKGQQYTGTVSSVDTSAKNLVVKGKGGEKTFDASDAKWKGYSSLDDVKAGDKVTVMYTKEDDTMKAKSIAKSKVGKTTTKTKTETTTTKTKDDMSDSGSK
ncbi:MAG: hypothetical protein ABFD12_08860 [Syntrophorhabdus sp.]